MISKTVKLILVLSIGAIFMGCGSEDTSERSINTNNSSTDETTTNGNTITHSTTPFIVKIKPNRRHIIRLYGGDNFNYDVDWGDGTSDTITSEQKEHTYLNSEIYTISIKGVYPKVNLNCGRGYTDLISVEQWGDTEWISMKEAFSGCKNMKIEALDTPSLTHVTDMSHMFEGASNFNQDINSWNVSKVKDMSFMFHDASKFNQDISSWDTSSVKNMYWMFTKASDFNQDIGSWSVSKVKNMEFMFGYAKSFNQDISSWDISSVEKIGGLFFDAEKFNQDISSWDISKINSLQEMFKDAYTFNQDLSSWNFSNIDNMIDFMENSNLSTTNYDKLLRAWVSGDIQDNVSLSVGDTKYNKQAESTRFELINQHGWSITDGGLNN